MNNAIDDWTWALQYTGEPSSFEQRSAAMLEWLIEAGMKTDSHVLDIGAGCLAPGAALIEYLNPGRYTGIEPNGLLVNVALRHFPHLEGRAPRFLFNTDFDASALGIKYDFVISHSVMSHMAHNQMPQALAAVRAVVDEDAIWLSSFRNDQFNSFHSEWRYPSTTTFRLATIEAWGVHFGWRVKIRHDLKERMSKVSDSDIHDWLELTAVPSLAEWNARRLAEDEQLATEQKSLEIAEERHRWAMGDADKALEMGAADLKRLHESPPPRLVNPICPVCGGTDEHGHRAWCVSEEHLLRCEAVLGGETRCQRERHHEGNHAYTSPVDGKAVSW